MEPIDDSRSRLSHPSLLTFFPLLILAVLIGALIGGGLAMGIGLGLGISPTQMTNPDGQVPNIRTFLRLSNLVSHLFTFTLAGLVITWVFYRQQTWRFLQLHHRPGGIAAGLGILWALLSFPMAQSLYWINRQLPMPEFFVTMEESATRLLEILMTMNSPGELLLNLVVIGVVPAIGEELLFRGILQRRLQDYLPGAAAVWLTAFIFSAIHLQFAGFFPRMLLGGLLGYLFLWSRNLWVPILAHFAFNASQVLGQYIYGEELAQLEAAGPDEPYWLSGILSFLLVVVLGWFMWRRLGDTAEKK